MRMVNGKAFVIAPKALSGMNCEKLYNGRYLNWYDGLSVTFSADKRYALIGECWSIKKDEIPKDYLKNTKDLNTEMILARENYWCGRYVLILEDSVYMDAVGTMSFFYSDEYSSNSLNLLRELLGLRLKNEKLYDGLSPDFVPGTETQYDGIKRLLPSLVYDIKCKTVTTRPLLPEFPVEFQSEEERLRVFVSEFAQCLKNLDRHFEGKTKLIACTGGRDSRAILAVSRYAGLCYDTCLLEHESISKEDIDISAQLSKEVEGKHFYIKQDKARPSAERLSDFDRHTCNYEKGADRRFYEYGQFEDLRKQIGNDIVILRGAIWGVTIEYYTEFMKEDLQSSIRSIFPLVRYQKRYSDSINDWLNCVVNDTCNQELRMSNRIFWELREGCWLSTIEQSFDIYEGITSVQPINCRRLIALLMGFDYQVRKKKRHQERITEYACPALADIPYDYQIAKSAGESAVKRYGEYFKKAIYLLLNFGPGAVMSFAKNKIG